MQWLALGLAVLLGCLGFWLLLTGNRIAPAGTDEQANAALAHQRANYKTVGWCIVAMAVIALVGGLFGLGY
jgi:uncharacterized membrane protein YfcA